MGATVDARALRETMARYLDALRSHRQEIDSLNVFPVPDGDTGTNMLLTQQAVDQALRGLEGASLAEVGDAVSRAALMGARGNSGVILSQVLRGLCARLCAGDAPGATDLAEALEEASEQAERAVAEPVEGTMLSVLRDAAGAARAASGDGAGPGDVAAAALEEATASLERTRELLPALAEAGVVDAGGRGIVLFFDALVSVLRDVPLSVEVGPQGPVGGTGEASKAAPATGTGKYGYEVMYLVECGDDRIPALREGLGPLGDSLVIVGGGDLFNVHVHTDDPTKAVDLGNEVGRTRGIRITSLDEQVAEACLAGEARSVRVAEPARLAEPAQPCALVAVAPGDGVATLFRSLGATVVPGGPGRNPSVGELLEAVDGTASGAVILLPNHGNVIPAAWQAAGRSTKAVEVIPAGSVAEGLAAAAAFKPEADAQENAARAREALEDVVSLEVAVAVRDGDTPAGPVRSGQYIGVVDERVSVVGDDPVEVSVETLRSLVREEHEVLTVLAGEGLNALEEVRASLAEAFPSLEVEVHRGGQPSYPLLMGLE
jgi:DAK2 domain fusion protein YloV